MKKLKTKHAVIGGVVLLDCIFCGIVISGKNMKNTANSLNNIKSSDEPIIVERVFGLNNEVTDNIGNEIVSQEDMIIAQEIIAYEQGGTVEVHETTTPISAANTASGKVAKNIIVSNSNKIAAEKRAEQARKDNASLAKAIANNQGSALGIAIAQYAVQFVGNPYVWGGTSLTKGADCSGFVLSVYKHFGMKLTHSARAQARAGREISLSEIQPGDLVFYSHGDNTIQHVAIYIGDGKIVHAQNPKDGIGISSVFCMKRVKICRMF